MKYIIICIFGIYLIGVKLYDCVLRIIWEDTLLRDNYAYIRKDSKSK